MQWYLGALLIALLAALSGDAGAGLGLGMSLGIEDAKTPKATGGGPPGCIQGALQFNGACNSVYWVMGY